MNCIRILNIFLILLTVILRSTSFKVFQTHKRFTIDYVVKAAEEQFKQEGIFFNMHLNTEFFKQNSFVFLIYSTFSVEKFFFLPSIIS